MIICIAIISVLTQCNSKTVSRYFLFAYIVFPTFYKLKRNWCTCRHQNLAYEIFIFYMSFHSLKLFETIKPYVLNPKYIIKIFLVCSISKELFIPK